MKSWKKILIASLAVLIPVGGYCLFGTFQKSVYSESYLAELPAKYERLKNANKKKIVFVSASSMAFGLRSDIIEKELPDYEAINMGLYVTLKSKATLEIVLNHLSEGDILVYAPEPISDLYSSELAKEPFLEATENAKHMACELSEQDQENLLAASFDFNWKRFEANFQGTTFTSNDPYNRKSFNSYGDIGVATPYNEMVLGYDPSLPIAYSPSLLSPTFLSYIASVKKRAEEKKASFYYSFSPVDNLAYQSNPENNSAFEKSLTDKLGECLLSGISDHVYDSGYFYDTNFHLNDTGKVMHSVHLVNELKTCLKISTPTETIIPDPSGMDPNIGYHGEEDNTFEAAFTYKKTIGGFSIIGVDEAYKQSEYFVLPTSHEGKTVVEVGTDALMGCDKLMQIKIGGNIRLLDSEAFSNLPQIKRIDIYNNDPTKIAPPTGGRSQLLDKSNEDVRIFVPKDSLSAYKANYNWITYQDILLGM